MKLADGSEYSSTLKRDGFEKLASAIDRKIAELREEGEGGASDG